MKNASNTGATPTALSPSIGSAMPTTLWAYYTNSGKTLRYTLDRDQAERNADGFTWDNPRVRPVGKIVPLLNKTGLTHGK